MRYAISIVVSALLTAASATIAMGASQVENLYGRQTPAVPAFGRSTAQEIAFRSTQAPGTLIIDVAQRYLYLVEGPNEAVRYRISVGRDGFGWSGTVYVRNKREWPEWRPPADMRKRQPGLPEIVPAGPYNPLGARALYLYRNGRDTLYRIHGTNHAQGVGQDGTSGCFRLTNTDILDLYRRVPLGTKVIVR
jgi:lipoprotein-anchoring transpeptidase ErfK/SrfK